MQTQEKSFLLLLQNYFSEKKTKLFEREILTSRKVLYTKFCTHNFFLVLVLRKRCFQKYGFFLLKMSAKNNWHSMFVKIFQVSADKEKGK